MRIFWEMTSGSVPYPAPWPGRQWRHVQVSPRRRLGYSHVFPRASGLRILYELVAKLMTVWGGLFLLQECNNFWPPSIRTLRPRWRGHQEFDSEVFCHRNLVHLCSGKEKRTTTTNTTNTTQAFPLKNVAAQARFLLCVTLPVDVMNVDGAGTSSAKRTEEAW